MPYRPDHFIGVDGLWHACFPDDPPRNRAAAAIPAKLALGDDLLFVAESASGQVLGSGPIKLVAELGNG